MIKSWYRQLYRLWCVITVARNLLKIERKQSELWIKKILKDKATTRNLTTSNINKVDSIQLTYLLLELNGFASLITLAELTIFFDRKDNNKRNDGYDLIFYILKKANIPINISKTELVALFNGKNYIGNGFRVSPDHENG